jgi:serine/threonine protein kinase
VLHHTNSFHAAVTQCSGFQPPEYIHGGKISEKFDIFSLGAVITRILSGPLFHPEIPDISSYEYIDQVRNK